MGRRHHAPEGIRVSSGDGAKGRCLWVFISRLCLDEPRVGCVAIILSHDSLCPHDEQHRPVHRRVAACAPAKVGVGVVRVVRLGVQVGGGVAKRKAARSEAVAGRAEGILQGQPAGHARVGLERVADDVVEALRGKAQGGQEGGEGIRGGRVVGGRKSAIRALGNGRGRGRRRHCKSSTVCVFGKGFRLAGGPRKGVEESVCAAIGGRSRPGLARGGGCCRPARLTQS